MTETKLGKIGQVRIEIWTGENVGDKKDRLMMDRCGIRQVNKWTGENVIWTVNNYWGERFKGN